MVTELDLGEGGGGLFGYGDHHLTASMYIVREATQISKTFLDSIEMPIFLGLTYAYYL